MFRGGDYMDDPGFADLKNKPGYDYMNVSDINNTDRYGNSNSSPSHQKYKYRRDAEAVRQAGRDNRMSPLPSPKE